MREAERKGTERLRHDLGFLQVIVLIRTIRRAI